MDEFEAMLAQLAARFRLRCRAEHDELLALRDAGDGDHPRVKQLAHGLAGAGGTFGFAEISSRARRVEEALDLQMPVGHVLDALLEALADARQSPA